MFESNIKKTTRVAVIVDSIKHGGGAEKNAALLATLLARSGVDVTLFTFYSFKNEYACDCSRVSLNEQPKNTFIKKTAKALHRLQKIKRFCVQNNISHVIAFLDEASTYALLTRLLLFNRSKIIVSVRVDPTFCSTRSKLIIKILYPLAHRIVGVSLVIERILREQFRLSNVLTIYNPVDQDLVKEKMNEPLPPAYRHLGQLSRGPMFVNIGRLREQKGQSHLIDILAKFVQRFPSAKLIIIGEGAERGNLQKKIVSYGLEKSVFLVGHQNNIYPFLRISDCFVLSSLYEGFPNVLLEAAASGLYIISTDCRTGPREIIAPEKIGERLQYPYRVIGASLVPDFSNSEDPSVDAVDTFYQEMVWATRHAPVRSRALSVDRFSNQEFLSKWVGVLT